MKYNTHHIIYAEKEPDADDKTVNHCFDDRECQCCGYILQDDWTVDIPAFLHKHMHIIQGWAKKPTYERYALLTAFLHAVTYCWNEMRRDLDHMDDEEGGD